MEPLRFEVKIPIPAAQKQRLMAWLKSHPMLFREQYAPRVINSLYLDSCNLSCYEENLSGLSERKKARIRWYGNIAEAEAAKLEFKLRKSGKGRKIIFNAPLDLAMPDFSWHDALRDCREHLPDEGKIYLGNCTMPVLICRYHRQYFISDCQKIRATIDSKIEVFDQRYNDRLNIDKPRCLGHYYLLELKTEEGSEEELSQLIGTCPLRPTRHSKYVNGIRKLFWR